MALVWFNTNQYQQIHGVKAAVYGASGTGKTKLVSTLPAPFVISIESGMMTLRKENIHGLIATNLEDFKDAFNWVTRSQEAAQFASIAIDSISELAEKILEQKLNTNKDGRKAYGEMQQELVPWIKGFRDLPNKNVLFTFKEEYVKDDITGMMKWAPSMPGRQLIKDAPYWFDEVFRALVQVDPQTGQRTHFLQCQRIGPDEAKDRSGVLDVYEPSDMAHIFNKIANS